MSEKSKFKVWKDKEAVNIWLRLTYISIAFLICLLLGCLFLLVLIIFGFGKLLAILFLSLAIVLGIAALIERIVHN